MNNTFFAFEQLTTCYQLVSITSFHVIILSTLKYLLLIAVLAKESPTFRIEKRQLQKPNRLSSVTFAD